MNRDWYSKQVLYINGIEDPHFIKAGDVLQMPIYIDSGIEGVTDYIGTDKKAIPKAEFIQHIKNSILTGYEEITIKEWKEENTEALIAPKYLPERFQYYGVFVQDNPGIPTEKMTSQLWYDYDKLEILLVTQMKNQSSNTSGKFVFTDSLEGEGKIRDVFPWAKFRSNYDFNQNGISVYGYMLVNDEANKDECERILKSMHD